MARAFPPISQVDRPSQPADEHRQQPGSVNAEPFTHDPEIARIEARLVELNEAIRTELGKVESEQCQAARVDLDVVEDDDYEAGAEVEVD